MASPKVVLDPGHGKYGNPYPAASGYYEGTQMFKLATYLKAMLTKSGVTVIMTRKNVSDDPSLETRGKTAGNNGAKLFISLHSDAIGSYVSTSAKGVTMFYSIKDTAKNKPFATKFCSEIATLLGTTNRGAQTRVGTNGDWYGVIRNSAASGCPNAFLIEHGFHTNPTDVAKLINDDWLKKIALKECELICDFLGIKSTATIKDATSTASSSGSTTTTSTEKYALYAEVPVYTTAANASAKNKSLASGTITIIAAAEGLFSGKTFCFTGELVSMKRADAEQIVRNLGGSCKSSVTKDLSYLVTNDTESGSSKNKKAAQFGIPVITEKEFLSLAGK